MIVTLTPNPSLDRTLEVEHLREGAVNRAGRSRVEAGGKGVNVARALLAHGEAVRAVLPLGGPEGDHLHALLAGLDLDVRTVPIAAATRTNVTLAEADGTVTKVNAPGPSLQPGELEALVTATTDALAGATWLAACGSLPTDAPDDLYARLVARAHEAGVRVAVDTSGAPLEAVVAAGPDLVKPNGEELATLVDRPLPRLGDVVAAAAELRQRGVGAVLVSLGRHGAVLVDAHGATSAATPAVTARSDVGAGDAALAGFLAGGGAGPDALRRAVAFGAAAVRLPGTAMPTPHDVDLGEVRLHAALDPDRELTP